MRLISSLIFFLLAIGTALYALVAYGLFPLGALVHPDMLTAFQTHVVGVYTHVFASLWALALGPFQFLPAIRQRRPMLHRWTGRIYLIAVLVGGLSGLYLAQFSFGGMISHTGFTLLALVWLVSGVMAYRAIRRRDFTDHRRWMVRNYALTFAAVTLRLYLGVFLAAGVAFETFYPWLAWLCWIPNLLIAEWYFNAHHKLAFVWGAAPNSTER